MSDILKKYKDMANTRDDFNTINPANFMLPTMGEMVQEDLMSEIYQQYVDNDVDGDKTNQSHLDAAYYNERPFSLTPGYHPAEAAFILKARNLAKANDPNTWSLNRYDGDTTGYKVDDLDDGNNPFTFNDGNSYSSFKNYYDKIKGSDTLTIRHAGINAPEIPHLEIQAIPKKNAKYSIVEMTFKEMKDLMRSHKTKQLDYLKFPLNADKTKVIPRKDTDKVKLLKYEVTNTGTYVYKEIIGTPKDSAIPDKNENYSYYTIVFKDESESNTIVDGYKAQNIIKNKLANAKEIILMVDANQLTVKNFNKFPFPYNSIYYTGETIEYLLEEWKKSYKDLPSTNYSYAPYGADAYSRSLGAIYIKDSETVEGQNPWINLNKYVAAQLDSVETNPDYNSSPELQEMKNGMSEAFQLWSYDKDNIQWLDSFNSLTKKSYADRIALHKELTGIDYTKERNCALLIGDTMMLIPPENIRNVTQVNYERLPNMRSKGTMAKQMGQNEHMLELTLYFYDDAGLNGIDYNYVTPNGTKFTYKMNGLRSLLAQFKVAPYLPIENGYINDVLGIEAVCLMNLHTETVKGFPRLIKAILTLREFNYRTFMPDLPIDDNYGENSEGELATLNPLFAKCFDWEIFRYYYQRAIMAGENLSHLDFASYDYNFEYYRHKNSVGPYNFCPPEGMGGRVSFYIPDENWLEQALALKKEREKNPLSNFGHVELSDKAKAFLQELKKLQGPLSSVTSYQNKNFAKAVNNIFSPIRTNGQTNRQVLAEIPDFNGIFETGKIKGGIRNESIADKYNSCVYLIYDTKEDKNVKSKKNDFRDHYIKHVRQSFLDGINNASYMSAVGMNEIIKFDVKSQCYIVTWEFAITLNFNELTDDDMIAIRETLSKAAGVELEDVFKDGVFKVNFEMKFEPVKLHLNGRPKKDGNPNLEGKGDVDALVVLGGSGENAGTATLKHVSSIDEKCLAAITKVLDEGKAPEGNTGSNIQDKGIDFYIRDYKNPANMPFVPYVQDVMTAAMASNMANTFTNINLKAIEGVGPQYLGGQDVQIELELLTDDLVVVSALNNLPQLASSLAKRYRKVLPAWPIKIKSDLTNLLGVSEVLIDMLEVNTVEGFPGVYSIGMRLTSVDRTQRQREAMRRLDITPTGGNVDYNGHSNLALKSYFSIEEQLSKAELYPDLDLPSLTELGKLGFRFVKYSGQNRSYPDPDFYIVYNYPYTALILKKLVKDTLSKQLLNIDGKDTTLHSFKLKDTLGADVTAKVETYTGLSIDKDSIQKGSVAETYEEMLLENKKVVREKLKNLKYLNKDEVKETEDKFELSGIIKFLTMCDMHEGWEIKPGWKATLAEEATNDAIREAKEKDSHNAYADQIKDLRKKALRLIDDMLTQPLTSSAPINNDVGFEEGIAVNAVNNMFSQGKGKELMELLFPGMQIQKAPMNKGGSQMLGTPDKAEFNKKYFSKPQPLNFIVGFLYSAGCAISGHEEYNSNVTQNKWAPNHYGFESDANSVVYSLDKYNGAKMLMPYCTVERRAGASKLASSIEDGITNGTCFGAYRITKFSTPGIVSKIADREDNTIMYGGVFFDETYKDRDDQDKKSKKKVKAGFLDPYYNYLSDYEYIDEKTASDTAKKYHKQLKDYKTNILVSKQYNCEAFLRNVLVFLRKMILDGLFISEIDILARDYDALYKELDPGNIISNTYLPKSAQVELAHTKQGKSANVGEALKALGFKPDEMKKLLDTIKEANYRNFCVRMAYPFLMAITNCNNDIYNTIQCRDYDKLNALTGYVSGGDQNVDSRSKVIKFVSALGGIKLSLHKEGKNESSVSASQKLINSMMKDVYIKASEDPRTYILHSFYDMLVNDKRGRLARAFPTYYVVFVDEGRKLGSWKLHDNFYNMNSIGEIQVVKSRKIAADTCTITMNNMFGSYAQEPDITTTQQYTDIYGLRDVFDSIFSPELYFEKEKKIRLRQNVPDKVVLQPGIRIHVRMGYSGDGAKLPIVFNGKVAEVSVEDVCQIVAQGDGHELMNPLNAFGEIEVTALDEAQDVVTWFKDIRGSLSGGGETPRDLLAKLLTAKFGGFKKMTNQLFDGRWFNDNPFGIMHFGDQKFTNIFELGEVTQNLYEVADDTLLKGVNQLQADVANKKVTPIINTSLQDKTFWDILHLCANSGIEYVGAIRDFGFRSTVCLCRPNHYYAYAYELVDGKVVERRKPFQQYHYYDSYNDIIYNSIKASEAQMKTNAVGLWQASSAWWGREQATVGPIYLDMNIYPEYQKSMTVDTGLLAAGNGGIDIPIIDHFAEEWNLNPNDDKVNKSTAWRVTANALKDSVKDMYQGDVAVIGDPSVKPHDRIYIHDTYEDMMGQFEVEAVIHTMSVETGFTTSIMPDVIARHDDTQEGAVQGLLSSFYAVVGTTAVLNTANILWTVGVNNKLVTSICKSKALYGASSRLNKFAADFGNASGMKKYLEKHPAAKQLFSTLSFNPEQTRLDLHRTGKILDDLADLTLDKGLFDDFARFARVFDLSQQLDMKAYQESIQSAFNNDKYGMNKGVIGQKDIDHSFKEMNKAYEAIGKEINYSELNLKQFADDILKDAVLMDDVKGDMDALKILQRWSAAEGAVDVNGKALKEFSHLINNGDIQKAIVNRKLEVKGMETLFDGYKKVFSKGGLFKKAKYALKGGKIIDGILDLVRTALKFNWATLLADVVLSTITYVLTKNVKSMITRWMQEIQAIDVYPLKKNGKPLIAGMNGNKGSVYGYPVKDGYNSIQGMIMQGIQQIKDIDGSWPFADELVNMFVDENVYEKLSAEWRKDLMIDDPDKTGLTEGSEDLTQNVMNSISSSYAAGANHAYAIKTRYRIQSFDTKGKTDPTYKFYEIKGVTTSNMAKNEKVKKLYYVNRDNDIWKAIVDNRFEVAHSKGYTNLVTIPFESGNEKVPVFIKDNVIDTPLVHEECMYILKSLALDESLKNGKVYFKSGARLNDPKTWKNTGFAFTLEYRGSDKTFEESLKKIKSDTKFLDNRKEMFEYQKKGSKFLITVYAPAQNNSKGEDK